MYGNSQLYGFWVRMKTEKAVYAVESVVHVELKEKHGVTKPFTFHRRKQTVVKMFLTCILLSVGEVKLLEVSDKNDSPYNYSTQVSKTLLH